MKKKQGLKWVNNKLINMVEVAPGLKRKVITYCDEMMCVENYFEKDVVGILHQHPEIQITYVLSGLFEFEISGERNVVKPGDAILAVPMEVHGCVCIEKGILLEIYSPARKEFV